MKYLKTWALMIACCWAGAAHAQLQLAPGHETQRVFAGDGRKISVVFHNPTDKKAEVELRTRLAQLSSATVIPLGEKGWKKLQVLPGQTIIESATLSFPTVKAETRFLVQWLESTNTVIGKTEVLVYPPDMLKELKPMAGDEPLGVFDPQNQIKPLLKAVAVEFTDLEDAGLEGFRGKLAIVGPFKSKTQMREGLANQIETLAKKGAAVVWIQPPPERRDKLQPSFQTMTIGQGGVVIVQAELVAGLSEHPQSQLNLIHFARLALHPEPARLPHLIPQP